MSDENHQKFIGHLEASEPARWLVARWLNEKGKHVVRIPPMDAAPTQDQARDFQDEGDLEICQRVEVKKLKVKFTCAQDWPYKSEFIVCAKHAWDKARPKPHAFVIVSACKQYAAIVMGDSFESWTVQNKADRRYENVRQDFYYAPVDKVKWIKL